MKAEPPQRFKLPCAWCDYYVDAPVQSGAGEDAAAAMAAHLMNAHPDKNWMQYLAATSGSEPDRTRFGRPTHDPK